MENEFIKTLEKKFCNGCGICALECPKGAISMKEDNEGFFYPEIDQEKCIHCGKCEKVCSNFNNSHYKSKAYMAINKNEEQLKNSASGGIFMVLANYVIEKKGVVFGVKYGDNLQVEHDYGETIEECKKFQGSKYVRSNINDSYQKVKKFLENDRWVLFTGTPCQCQALKVYLKKDYEKLVICDIICHANPSQKVFNKYKKEMEIKKGKKIVNIHFRSKDNGWKNSTPIIEFEDGEKIEEKSYYNAFVGELFNRPSCHECKFSGIARISDFTIGDFWGVHKILKDIQDLDTGISLMTVNSDKGEQILEQLKSNLILREVELEVGFKYNHHSNVNANKNREKFFDNLNNDSIIEEMNKAVRVGVMKKCYIKFKRIVKKIMSTIFSF